MHRIQVCLGDKGIKIEQKGQNTSVWFPIKVFIVTITVVVVRFYGFNMSMWELIPDKECII